MCTGVRFSDDEGNMYFGRNLDWSFSYGETILVTPRGYQYDYVYGPEGKSEPNAVIGVGVVMTDRPMYFDCANEHGLAIAGLNFPGYASFAHEPVEGTENVATFEFPLWVARNFDSVDEVEEALKNVTLVSQVVPGQQESLLHWFIGDGTRSIVVEQMADGMHIHHDDVDVLTNQPTFDFHMENLRNYMMQNILYVLCDQGSRCSQSEIGRLTGISRQTINSAIRKLERDGIVYLEQGQGRNTIVCLTEQGKAFAAQRVVPLLEAEQKIWTEWTPE